MVRMSNDPGRRAAFAAKSREEYAPISWQVMKERYLTLMDELTRSRSLRPTEVINARAPLTAA